MNPPKTAIALVAAAFVLLAGCGGEEKVADDGTDACKNAVYKRYDDALAALASSSAGKSAEAAAAQFQEAVGSTAPPECDKVRPVIAEGIVGQVAMEYSDKIEAAFAVIESDKAQTTASPSASPGSDSGSASESTAEPSASPSPE